MAWTKAERTRVENLEGLVERISSLVSSLENRVSSLETLENPSTPVPDPPATVPDDNYKKQVDIYFNLLPALSPASNSEGTVTWWPQNYNYNSTAVDGLVTIFPFGMRLGASPGDGYSKFGVFRPGGFAFEPNSGKINMRVQFTRSTNWLDPVGSAGTKLFYFVPALEHRLIYLSFNHDQYPEVVIESPLEGKRLQFKDRAPNGQMHTIEVTMDLNTGTVIASLNGVLQVERTGLDLGATQSWSYLLYDPVMSGPTNMTLSQSQHIKLQRLYVGVK